MILLMQESLKSGQSLNQITTNQITAAAWDCFVEQHPDAHLLQSSQWAALKSRFGWHQELITVADDAGSIRAGALLLYRRVAGLTMAYVPRGPLVDWQDAHTTTRLLAAIDHACRLRGAAFLKIEPSLPATPSNHALLATYGFQPSPQTVQPPSTILLDIRGDEAALLNGMKSKWRYNIRLAERRGITVRTATRADLPAFHALMQATGSRDGFAVHSADYYAAAFDLFTPERAAFLLAEYEGEVVAALVVACLGPTAIYLWGASGDRERQRMPNHALQWAALRWARERGATHYDFWGIPDELGHLATALSPAAGAGVPVDALPINLEALPSHDLWGVYRFKQGFGGQVVRTIGAWDMPINRLGYGLYQVGLEIKKRVDEIKEIGGSTLQSPNLPISQSPISPSLSLHLIQTPETWRAALAALPNPHFLQSWEWGEIKAQTGWQAERYLLSEGAQPRAAFQLLWRQLTPQLPLRVAYVAKGPLLDWQDLDLVDATLAQIEQIARAKGCIFVKVDPDVDEAATAGRMVMHSLARRGWNFSREQIQFKNTAISDLRGGEDALLAAMKQKWRYNIRLAERRGITIRVGGEQDLHTFYDLYAETSQRDGFLIRPYAYYQLTWQRFLQAQAEPNNPAGGALLLAEHPDDPQPLAGILLLRYGTSCWYFNGASSERHRRDMPNYLLQWAGLRWASEQGCTKYDWWGAPTDLDDPEDVMQGVWQFKQGFGATWQPHIGAWDFALSAPLYRLYVDAMPRVLSLLKRWRRGG